MVDCSGDTDGHYPRWGNARCQHHRHRSRPAAVGQRFLRHPSRPRRTRGAVFPAPDARHGSAFAAFGRRFGELEINVANLSRAGLSRSDDPVEHEATNGKPIGAERCRPGLAHRHVVQPRHRARQRPARTARAVAQRQAARRDAVPQHARRLRRSARCVETQAGRPHRDARLRQVLGRDAQRPARRGNH